MAHGMRRMAFQPRSHQHQGGNTLQHLQHIKGGAVLKLVAADHDVHAALAHTLQPRLHAGGHIHLPAQPGVGKADTTTCAWQALLSMRRDADRHGDARLPTQLQEPYPAACRSPLPQGPGAGPGYKYVGFIAVLCVRGRTRAARLPLCREVAHGAHNLEQYRAWRCSTVQCARVSAAWEPVFSRPRVFPRGASPLWGAFCRNALASGARPHAMQSFSVNQYLRQHIRTVPDWPAPGVQFRDITPLLQDPQGVPRADRRLCAPLHGQGAAPRRGGRAGCARLHPGRRGGL